MSIRRVSLRRILAWPAAAATAAAAARLLLVLLCIGNFMMKN